MKKTWVAIALALITLASTGRSFAGPPDNPFPLDYPVKFPWTSIEGIWAVTNGSNYEFSFQVQSDCEGREILHVVQLDPSGAVVAEGIGYKQDSTLEVYAAMMGNGVVGNYVLHIGAYRDTHSAGQKRIVILKVMPFGGGAGETDYRLTKEPGRMPVIRADEPTAPCALPADTVVWVR